MERWTKLIIIILVILCIILITCIFKINNVNNIQNSKEYIEKIDSLESTIKIISNKKDSINTVIDTVFVQVFNNNKVYEKNCSIINNNSINENHIFFTEYINGNKARLDSINNR